MKQLKLQYPDNQTVQDWYSSSMSAFRDDNWLGKPDSSIEVHLLSGTEPVEDKSVGRLEPLLDNLRLMGCVKDISLGEMSELNNDEKYRNRLAQIDRSYAERSTWEMSSYLKNIYDAVPDRDVSIELFSAETELDNLNYNLAIVEEIEEFIQENNDFSLTGIGLSAYSAGNNPDEAYADIDNSLFFDIFFLYGGDQDLVQEYNQLTDERGDKRNYSGVPGVINVGNGRPAAFLYNSQELSDDGSRIDSWLRDELKPNIGVKSKVRKEN